ncbi:MAG: O-antigen translocase [Gammaproteobacteria bacterium]
MTEKSTYGQALKASAVIGGSSLLNVAIGIIRTKAMAVLLAPSGMGLMGLYGSITDLTQSIAGMGINNSGVRQIAEAAGSGESQRIAKTARVLGRTAVFLGIFGALFLFGFSNQLSLWTFGSDRYSNGVALLSFAVFFNLVSQGQGALIQGMRRISDLAKMSILGALYGTLISIPTVYFLREDGVALALVLIAAMTLGTSWWYRRKIQLQMPSMTLAEIGQEQAALLKLGFAFMSSGLLMTGSAYVVRMIIVRHAGIDAAGLYQSAWALGGLYVGFVLQAMGTDFYPRLTAVANDNRQCNRVVNEQAHISLLLAGPGVLGTLTLASLVIALFYTSRFSGAVDVLRWLCLGMALRVVSWPMGYIVIAKGAQFFFIFSELAWTFVYLGLAWLCVNRFGLDGAGIAFFGSYIFHTVMIYLIVRRLSDFRCSAANRRTNTLFLCLILVVFWAFHELSFTSATGIGILATGLSGIYSLTVILSLVSTERIPRFLTRLLSWFKLLKTEAESGGSRLITTADGMALDSKPVSVLNKLLWLLILITTVFICLNRYQALPIW